MENINQHIVELVLRYQSVIIPKLGCLTKTTQFSNAQNTSITKSENLSFEQNSKLDDGMLYKYVALKNDQPYNKAKTEVDTFVSDLKIAIFNKEKFEIAPLGTFFLSNEDLISFEYNTKFSVHPELFGSKAFVGQPILRNLEKETLVQEKANKSLYWATACLVPLLGLSIYFGMNKQAINENSVPNSAGLSEISITAAKDFLNLDQLIDINFDHEIEEEEKLIFFDLKPKKKLKAISKKGYQIIVGVFGEKKNAENLVESLNKDLQIEKYKGMFKVSSKLYASKSTARKDLNIVRNTNPKAWLLKVK